MLLSRLKDALNTKITRTNLRRFLEKHQTNQMTLDVGSSRGPYRDLFPVSIAGDLEYRPSLDLVLDAHKLPFADESFETILCTEVLEHCVEPHVVIDEFYRCLKLGGVLILTTRFVFPIHDAPQDYFRFTKFGLLKICEAFQHVEIEEEVQTLENIAVLLQRLVYQVDYKIPLIKIILQIMSRLVLASQILVKKEYSDITHQSAISNIMTSGYYLVARK